MSTKVMVFSFMSGIVGQATLSIVMHTTESPSATEWTSYTNEIRKWVKKGTLKTLVFTDGGGPNAVQRKELFSLMPELGAPTCMVSSSPIVRGLTTALGWFNSQIKAVTPENSQEAFRYLDIPAVHDNKVWTEVARLRAELGNPDHKSSVRPSKLREA